MKAIDLDRAVTCPVCDGSGEEPTGVWGTCPRCDGTGSFNRYGDRYTTYDEEFDVEVTEVIVGESIEPKDNFVKFVQQRMPIEHPHTGGFNAIFGDYVPPQMNADPQNPPLKERALDPTDLAPADALSWAQQHQELGHVPILERLLAEQP